MKNCLYLRLTVAFALAQSAAACGALRYSHSAYKTVPVAAPKPIEPYQMVADTLFNVLANSLLEVILLLIAVVLFMRYRHSRQRGQRQSLQDAPTSYVAVKNKATHGSWHFNEENNG